MKTQQMTICLWFDSQAEEAANATETDDCSLVQRNFKLGMLIN